jgi:hypothetical protein
MVSSLQLTHTLPATLWRGLLNLEYAIVMRTTLLGLAVWFALILYVTVLGATTLEGCNGIANHIVCEPGITIVFHPV